MFEGIKQLASDFLEAIKDKPVRLISHHDTDGIISAAIITKTLRRLNKKFSVRIVKGLEEEIINEELVRNKNEILLFTDLASGSMHYMKNLENEIFIIDHHDIDKDAIGEKIKIFNPNLTGEDNICGGGLCYLFSKAIDGKNKDLANLAIIGMIGDRHETEISKTYQQIINDADELEIRKSLLIFSSTRPLRRSLEYSTSCYIPGVTGSSKGVLEILRENNISPEKSLYDLKEEELSKLITSIMIRRSTEETTDEIIGNVYLMKFFNRKEDVRELSLLINSCSRLGFSDVAISFCLQNSSAKEQAQEIYLKYKQELISGLRVAEKIDKVKGKGFVILNAGEKIKDTVIGTICSMLSSSKTYDHGTILIGMSYNQDKIKVSARIAGRSEKNLKEVLEKTVVNLEAEVGGHQAAAGCIINKEDEDKFIDEVRKTMEIEVVKI